MGDPTNRKYEIYAEPQSDESSSVPEKVRTVENVSASQADGDRVETEVRDTLLQQLDKMRQNTFGSLTAAQRNKYQILDAISQTGIPFGAVLLDFVALTTEELYHKYRKRLSPDGLEVPGLQEFAHSLLLRLLTDD